MKKFTLVSAFVFLLFSHTATVSASCGSIIYPEDVFYTGSEREEYEIEDCENPFGTNQSGYPIDLVIAGVAVEPNAIITIPTEGTTDYVREGSQAFYRHVLNDLIYFESYPDGSKPPILPGTYTAVFKTFSICLVQDTEKESILSKIYNFIIPTAHAMFCFGENRTFTVTFTLIAEEEIEEPSTGASNILFLPGFQASRLYTKNWLGIEDQLWTPNNNGDIRQLAMNENGESINNIYTRDILDTVFGLGSVYAGIGTFFDGLVTDQKIKQWKAFAYDWRYAVDDVVSNGTQYETERQYVLNIVETLAQDSYSGKVTIIGHSNGGLLAKALVSELEKQDKEHFIDTVILLASPQLGTPKAVGSLLHGYDQSILGGLLVRANTARETAINMPGVYALLPTEEYFADTNNAPVVLFDNSVSAKQFSAYGLGIHDVDALDAFITAQDDNRPEPATVYDVAIGNSTILTETRTLHNDILQSWRASSSVPVIEVAGTGLPTAHSFSYRPYFRQKCSIVIGTGTCSLEEYYKPVPQFSLLGDETVMAVSATGYRGDKETYYFNLRGYREISKIEHYNFVEADSVQNLVYNILFEETTPTPFITKMGAVTPVPKIIFGIHSPVTTTVTDSKGQQVKLLTNGDFIERVTDIPDSYVYYLGDTTYIILPTDDVYQVALQGTGSGLVTLEIDHFDGMETQSLVQSLTIPQVSTTSVVLTTIEETVLQDVLVDEDGDGELDYKIDAVTNEVLLLQAEMDSEMPIIIPTPKRKTGSLITPFSPLPLVAGVATSPNLHSEAELLYLQTLQQLLQELKYLLELYEKIIK